MSHEQTRSPGYFAAAIRAGPDTTTNGGSPKSGTRNRPSRPTRRRPPGSSGTTTTSRPCRCWPDRGPQRCVPEGDTYIEPGLGARRRPPHSFSERSRSPSGNSSTSATPARRVTLLVAGAGPDNQVPPGSRHRPGPFWIHVDGLFTRLTADRRRLQPVPRRRSGRQGRGHRPALATEGPASQLPRPVRLRGHLAAVGPRPLRNPDAVELDDDGDGAEERPSTTLAPAPPHRGAVPGLADGPIGFVDPCPFPRPVRADHLSRTPLRCVSAAALSRVSRGRGFGRLAGSRRKAPARRGVPPERSSARRPFR